MLKQMKQKKKEKKREDENLIKMKRVVDYCIEHDILKEYFTRKGEVYAMLKMEYSREYEVECTKKLIKKLQAKAEEAEAKLEEKTKAEAKLKETIADKDLVMYHQALNFEIYLINSGKGIEDIRPIAGCTEPYIEMIYTLVKEDSNITAEQLYDKAIKNSNYNDKENDLETSEEEREDDLATSEEDNERE